MKRFLLAVAFLTCGMHYSLAQNYDVSNSTVTPPGGTPTPLKTVAATANAAVAVLTPILDSPVNVVDLTKASQSFVFGTMNGSTSVPVPGFKPAGANQSIAFDLIPSGPSPVEGAGGFAWADFCQSALNTPTNYCARMAMTSTAAVFGGLAFNGGTPLPTKITSNGITGITVNIDGKVSTSFPLTVNGDMTMLSGHMGVNIQPATSNYSMFVGPVGFNTALFYSNGATTASQTGFGRTAADFNIQIAAQVNSWISGTVAGDTILNAGTGNLFMNTSGTVTAITPVFAVKGHVGNTGTALTATNLSNCGTSPTITGNDRRGIVTPGAGATACTITFATAYSSAPYVQLTPTSSAAVPFVPSTSTTAMTVGFTATVAFNYLVEQ